MIKKNWAIIVFSVIMVGCIVILNIQGRKTLYTQMYNNLKSNLHQMAVPTQKTFQMVLQQQVDKTKSFANTISTLDHLDSQESYELMQNAVDTNKLLRCAIAFSNGDFISNDKQVGNVAKEEFFIQSMNKEFSISDPRPAVVDSTQTVILFSGPIIKNNKVIGVVTFSYLCDYIESLLSVDIFGNKGYTMITDRDGNILVGNAVGVKKGGNILKYYQSVCNHKNHIGRKDYTYFDKEQDVIDFSSNDEHQSVLLEYNHLPINDWYSVTVVSRETAMQSMKAVTTAMGQNGMYLFVLLVIYVLILLIWNSEKTKKRDKMTGLLTIQGFKKVAQKKLLTHKDLTYIVVKFDVKAFKLINRVYGFEVGNKVIKNIAKALQISLVSKDFLGGHIDMDNFIFMILYTDREGLQTIREDFFQQFKLLMGENFKDNVTFPTGQYMITEEDLNNLDMDRVYEKVNFAHRFAKLREIDFIVDYEDTIEQKAIYQKEIEDQMEMAIKNEEFLVYVQPKYSLKEERIYGGEVLVRWKTSEGIIRNPNDFLPIFERNGFVVMLDFYMFERTVKMIKTIIDCNKEPHCISVNFSRQHILNQDFVHKLCQIADKYEVPHHYLEIELTESIFFDNIDQIVALLNELHQHGFSLSMDDFGSGYSSLALLKNIEADVIKLDRSFFLYNSDCQRGFTVIESILNLTQALNIKTVAEGIESKEYVDMLRKYGCDFIQGYYYSKPIPKEDYLKKYFSIE